MTLKRAIVTAVGPLRILIDGDTEPIPFTPKSLIDPATLTVGDVVHANQSGHRLVVLGRVGGNEQGFGVGMRPQHGPGTVDALDSIYHKNGVLVADASHTHPLPTKLPAVAGRGLRAYRDVLLGESRPPSSTSDDIVITTPMTKNAKMTRARITGYNYFNGYSSIDVIASWYTASWTAGLYHFSYRSMGGLDVEVHGGYASDNTVVLVLSPLNQTFRYTQIVVSEVDSGFGIPPASWDDGWSYDFAPESTWSGYAGMALATRESVGNLVAPGYDGVPFAQAAGEVTTAGWATVTWPSGRFSQPPKVTAQMISGSGSATGQSAMVTNASNTSCIMRNSEGTHTIHWHAIQMTSGSANG